MGVRRKQHNFFQSLILATDSTGTKEAQSHHGNPSESRRLLCEGPFELLRWEPYLTETRLDWYIMCAFTAMEVVDQVINAPAPFAAARASDG